MKVYYDWDNFHMSWNGDLRQFELQKLKRDIWIKNKRYWSIQKSRRLLDSFIIGMFLHNENKINFTGFSICWIVHNVKTHYRYCRKIDKANLSLSYTLVASKLLYIRSFIVIMSKVSFPYLPWIFVELNW